MYKLVAGINVASPRQNYELVMSHEELAAKLRTVTDDFDAMLEMRRQLSMLGYRFVSLLPLRKSPAELPIGGSERGEA